VTADPGAGPTVSVVVPTYRRPHQLLECLGGFAAQEVPADDVVVVVRATGDEGTVAALDSAPVRVRRSDVDEPGVLAALRRGAADATGDVIVFTDDDAVPHPDWLARIVPYFDDPQVGAVGGRDLVAGLDGPVSQPVGRVTAWGKLYGNHTYGTGAPRDVDVLKGVNMAFRRPALVLPVGLRGAGAQVHYEIAACLWARDRGWRVVFDPAIRVDHHPGPRFDADRRDRPAPSATADEAYNLVVTVLSSPRASWWRRAVYGLAIGDRATPGLLRGLAGAAQRDRAVTAKLAPSLRGQVAGLAAVRRRPLQLDPVSAAG